jgi:signal transduction histidine kinase
MRRRVRAAVAVLGFANFLFHFAWVFSGFGSDFQLMAFSDWVAVPLALFAAGACVWASFGDQGRARRSWLFLGAAAAAWGVGEIIWSYYETIVGEEVPFPGWADAGFLGLIPFALIAVLSLPTAPRGTVARLRAFFDGVIIAGSLLFIGWATVLEQSFADNGGGFVYRAISLAYPIGDLILIAIVIYVIGRARTAERSALLFIGGGLMSIAVSDIGFLWLNMQEMYATGSMIDPFWDLGFTLIALGALKRPRFSESVLDERRVGPASIVAPYVPFGLAVSMAGVVQVTRGSLGTFLYWTMMGVIVCLALRQVLALVDNFSLNRDLERRVDARTAELSQALSDLEESRRLQDQFVANTSHELLTPLTIITASLETLTFPGMDLNDEARRPVDMAMSATARMKRLVEDIMVTSGVGNHIDCDREPFDVAQAVREAIETASPKSKPVRMRAQSPTIAVGDVARFNLIVAHLVGNADKFAPEGSEIGVDVTTRPDGVHIVVKDSGPGIPADQRDSVFRRFYQVDGTSTRTHGGVGLGLFLARHLAQAMDGTLVVDDTESGASLRLVLPAAAGHIADTVEGMLYIPVAPHSQSGAA